VIVVGSGIQAFLVKTIFLDGLACRLPVFLRKEQTSQNRYTHMLDCIEEKGKGTSRAVKIL
jgi:hypothetical protein